MNEIKKYISLLAGVLSSFGGAKAVAPKQSEAKKEVVARSKKANSVAPKGKAASPRSNCAKYIAGTVSALCAGGIGYAACNRWLRTVGNKGDKNSKPQCELVDLVEKVVNLSSNRKPFSEDFDFDLTSFLSLLKIGKAEIYALDPVAFVSVGLLLTSDDNPPLKIKLCGQKDVGKLSAALGGDLAVSFVNKVTYDYDIRKDGSSCNILLSARFFMDKSDDNGISLFRVNLSAIEGKKTRITVALS